MFHLFNKRTSGADWLLVCLGNIGDRYEGTRHNVGFAVADEIGERENMPIQRLKFHALTNTFRVGDQTVLLMKPTTLMNLSGEAAGEAARFYKIPPEHVLVVCDDISLPVGKLRVRAKGSAGGHNGLKNIISHLGSQDFPRIKVGVGAKPNPEYDLAAWVLSPFRGEDLKVMEQAYKQAADAAVCVIAEGVPKAMNRFN